MELHECCMQAFIKLLWNYIDALALNKLMELNISFKQASETACKL